jgi:hypothetical protein
MDWRTSVSSFTLMPGLILGKSACRMFLRTGIGKHPRGFDVWCSCQLGSRVLAKVNSPWPGSPACDRIAFALLPPETGLRIRPLEKSVDSDVTQSRRLRSLRSALLRNIVKYGHVSCISCKGRRGFSAVQTAWRSAVNSNRQYNSSCHLPLSQAGFSNAAVCDRQPFAHSVCKDGPLLGC